MDTQKMNELKEDKGVALVEFFASWCPHCQRMMPIVADVKALLEGRANVYQFDIDKMRSLPTSLRLVLFLHLSYIKMVRRYGVHQERWRGVCLNPNLRASFDIPERII